MKNLPFTSRHLVLISVGVVFGFFLSFGLNSGILQKFLAELHIPLWTLTICIILFCIWLFAAMQKAAIVASYPKTAEYKQVNLSEIVGNSIAMDKLEECDAALRILGFKPIKDFSISNSPISVVGRLLINEEHQCRAEMFLSISSNAQQSSLPLTCAIGSYLNDSKADATSQLELLTVNNNLNAKSALEWALRAPLCLWSYHSDWNPEQLLSFHVNTRNKIAQGNQLKPVTGLSWQDYCRDSINVIRRRRKRLLRKPGIMLCLECWFCKNKTEWWGDYRKVMSQAV